MHFRSDYSQSTASEVVLFLRRVVPDEAFVVMIANEEARRGAPLSVWSLIVLSLLREHRRLSVAQMREFSRVESRRLVGAVESLVESGLVEACGSGVARQMRFAPWCRHCPTTRCASTSWTCAGEILAWCVICIPTTLNSLSC